MTILLSKAFKKASSLPDSLQDQLARQLLEELEWEPSIKNSSDKIDKLAEQALHEYKTGKTV